MTVELLPSDSDEASIESDSRRMAPGRTLAVRGLAMAAGFLVAFDDIGPLRNVGGGIAAGPGWIPLLVAAFLLPRHEGRRLGLMFWMAAATVTAIWIMILPSTARGDSILFKSVTVAIPVAIWLYIVSIARRMATADATCVWLFGLSALIVLACTASAEHAGFVANRGTNLLHATENYNYRLRGSRFEASSLGEGILVSLAIASLTIKRVAAALLVLFTLIAWLIFGQSRGSTISALTFALYVTWMILVSLGKPMSGPASSPRMCATLVTVVAGAGGAVLSWLVTSPLWTGFSRAGSDATRAVWGEVGYRSLMSYPFGLGFGAPLAKLPTLVEDSVPKFYDHFSMLDFHELSDLMHATGDRALAPKTLPSLVAVYFGVWGLIALLGFWWHLSYAAWRLKASGAFIAIGAIVVVCVISSTYFSSVYSWDQAFFFGSVMGLGHGVNRQSSWLRNGGGKE